MKVQRILLFLLICISYSAKAQQKVAIGLEQDVLPYITGGYYVGAWAGKEHIRIRGLVAHVHKPDFITPDGFTNNQVTAYAALVDYFLKQEWSGWWGSAGLVYWDNSIQKSAGGSTAYYANTLLSGSVGYQWKFYKHFYVTPWAGMHIRVGGAKEVTVDGGSFNTPVLNPEASLKIGWYFD